MKKSICLKAIVLLLVILQPFYKLYAQNQTVTNGAATAPVNFTSAGCRYYWTNSNPAIGLAASGMGNIPAFTAVNNGTTSVTATITATPVAAGYAYVPVDNALSVVDLSTNTVKAKIALGQNPDGVAITPDGSKVYITNTTSRSVSVISTANNTVTATIPLVNFSTGAGYVATDQSYGPIAGAPTGIAISPDGKSVYVANSGIAYSINTTDNSGHITGTTNIYVVYVIDTATGNVGMMSTGRNPTGLCFNGDGTLLYASDANSNIISVIDVKHTVPVRPLVISGGANPIVSAGVAAIKTNIVGRASPYMMVLTPDGSRMYITNLNDASVTVVNTATNTVITTINVGQGPRGICMSPDGSRVYVASGLCAASAGCGNSVAVISTATNAVVQTYSSLFDLPTILSLSPDGKLLYVENVHGSDITVLDVTNTANRVIDYIDLGGTPGFNGTGIGNFITPGSCSGSPVTFTITVKSSTPPNAALSNLSVNSGVLSPAFAPGTLNYAIAVSSTTTSVKLTPTAADPSAKIKINGAAAQSGSASAALPLVTGNNTFNIVITTEDTNTTKTYTVIVTKTSSNANLTSLTIDKGTLSPAFAAATTGYTAAVGYVVSSVKFTPVTSDAGATVTVNGVATVSGSSSAPVSLVVGANLITVKVFAFDGTAKTYKLTVTRSQPDASLSALAISAGTLTPVFASTTLAYTTTVSNTTVSIKITPTATDPNATITVNGIAVVSGAASPNIALATGNNIINTKITAPDGTTTQNYTITVARTSSNANLSALVLSSGTLSPFFASSMATYTATVGNAITSVTVTPTTSDAAATVTVNGVAVASRMPSAALPLAVGVNIISTRVTAFDGTVKTYKVTVTRAAATVGFAGGDITTALAGAETPGDGIKVHEGLSPNGDGIEDFLAIDGIETHPDNHLSVMNRSGQLIFDIKGYDNNTKVFDGHSVKGRKLQQAGTYFYLLTYKIEGQTKRKTGFIILKY